jgi:glycosyltransferase involved in cell wall biosynthesis
MWDKHLKVIKFPFWGILFTTRFAFLFFYPLICLLNTFYTIKSDTVFCYSSSCSKYFNFKAEKKYLYVNFPARGLINPEVFINNKIFLFFVNPLITMFKNFEKKQYQKFTKIYTISKFSQKVLKEFYNVDSEVLYCPTGNQFYENLNPFEKRNNSFILISRLEKDKNLEYVFELFNKSNFELNVIGTGTLLVDYKKKYPNILFKGFLTDENLIKELSFAKCCIIPTVLEYGLPIIESFSRGTPVISIKSPASRELISDLELQYNCKLGIIFDEPSSDNLLEAIISFNNNENNFDIKKILEISNIFHPNKFDESLKSIIYNYDN